MSMNRDAPKNETVLRDALYNLAPESGASVDYAMGVTVGIVSTLISEGLDFDKAISIVAFYMPHTPGVRLAVPLVWYKPLCQALNEQGWHHLKTTPSM